MYNSHGFSMHSPRSPIYSKTLASCTRVLYPPRFLQMAARRGASVFHVLWLGNIYMGSKGLAMHGPRSPIYGKTLASSTHTVYPLDFFGRRHAKGLVCSMCFC
jgi:hypothetical protein